MTKKNIIENYQTALNNKYSIDVVYDITFMTTKSIDTDAFTSYDYGSNRHLIEHKLITAVSRDGLLIYMNNRVHCT